MSEELRIEDLIKGKKPIGAGARRVVYDLDNGCVLKVAKSRDGIRSNKREVVMYEAAPEPIKDHIGKIKDYEPGCRWVIMKKYDQHFPNTKKHEQKLHALRAAFKRNGVLPYETVSWRLEPNFQNLRMKDDDTIVVIDYGNFRFRPNSAAYGIAVTDAVMPLVKEWRQRPLKEVYAVVFVHAISFKVKEEDEIIKKTAYMVIGIELDGSSDVLGIWIEEEESVKFWKHVLKRLKKRGVEHILLACVGRRSDLSEAFASRFPQTNVQQAKYPQKLQRFIRTKATMAKRHRDHYRNLTKKRKNLFARDEDLLKTLYLHTLDDWVCRVPNWTRLAHQLKDYFHH